MRRVDEAHDQMKALIGIASNDLLAVARKGRHQQPAPAARADTV